MENRRNKKEEGLRVIPVEIRWRRAPLPQERKNPFPDSSSIQCTRIAIVRETGGGLNGRAVNVSDRIGPRPFLSDPSLKRSDNKLA